MRIPRINEAGLNHLKKWIEATSGKDGGDQPVCKTDSRALDAWAQEAEESMGNGNLPMVEMDQRSTKSGHPETFIIPANGLDWIDADD